MKKVRYIKRNGKKSFIVACLNEDGTVKNVFVEGSFQNAHHSMIDALKTAVANGDTERFCDA